MPELTARQQAKELRLALQEAGVCPKCLGYGECLACFGTGMFPPPSAFELTEYRRRMKQIGNEEL